MCEEETPTLILRNNYYSMYNEMPAKNFTSFTQKLVGSGMFVKRGWVNIKTGERYTTKYEGERRDTYLVLERKPMEQIIKPLEKCVNYQSLSVMKLKREEVN